MDTLDQIFKGLRQRRVGVCLLLCLVLTTSAEGKPARYRRRNTPRGPASVSKPIDWTSIKPLDFNGDSAASPEASASSGSTTLTSPSPQSIVAGKLLGGLNNGGKSGGAKGGGSAGSGGSGGASAGGGSSGGAPGGLTMDENTPKGQGPGHYGNGGDGKQPDGNMVGEGQKKAIAYAKWFPMCIFMDTSVSGGNSLVKGMVDMAAKCGVNLVVWPFYIKSGYPSDPGALNALAKKSCNATEGLKQFGANRAAVTTLVNNDGIARQMCRAGGGQDINACGELGFSQGEGLKLRMAGTGAYGGEAGAGEVAASIVGPSGLTIANVAGVSQGRGQLSWPPGEKGGNGVGEPTESYAGAGSAPRQGWSEEGCAQMRATSFNNSDKRWKYDPDQKDYVVKDTDRGLLGLGMPLFTRPKQPPGPGPTTGGGGGSGGGGGGDSQVAMGGGNNLAGGADERHRKQAGGGGSSGGSGGAGGGGGVINKRLGNGVASAKPRTSDNIYSGGDGSSATENPTGTGMATTVASAAAAGANQSSLDSNFFGKGAGGESLVMDESTKKGQGGAAAKTATPGANGAGAGASGGATAGGPDGKVGDSYSSSLGATLASDLRNGSGILDDEFFKRIGKIAAEQRRSRGDSLRRGGRGNAKVSKDIYQ